jgi:hypothetical protein
MGRIGFNPAELLAKWDIKMKRDIYRVAEY